MIDRARVAALSISQFATMVGLLRSCGQSDHADNVEAAISAVIAIVSNEIGKDNLSRAMRWVEGEYGGQCLSEPFKFKTPRH